MILGEHCTYYTGLACPSLKDCTSGIHMPLYENPGCGGMLVELEVTVPVTANGFK